MDKFLCFPLSTFVNFNSMKIKTAAGTITKETNQDKPRQTKLAFAPGISLHFLITVFLKYY